MVSSPVTTTPDIFNQLNEWLSFPSIDFSRKNLIDNSNRSIDCDCSGLINLLFKNFDLPLPYQIENPKAVHYFAVLQEIGLNKIDSIKAGHLLAWRKDVLPKSGDTGHIVICEDKPKSISKNIYQLPVIDSTKLENGLSKRFIELHTDDTGCIVGVRWHHSSTKIKRTAIYHQSLIDSRFCFGCGLPKNNCHCHKITAHLDTPPIIIFRHPTERKRTLSTVSLIKQRYPNVLVKEGEVFNQTSIPKQANPLFLLFPNNESSHKNSDSNENQQKHASNIGSEKTTTFLLIDGTWKKAKKILHLNPWITALEKFSITPEKASQYTIRKTPDQLSLSSVETFSHVMQDSDLENYFEEFIQKHIELIGQETFLKNYK